MEIKKSAVAITVELAINKRGRFTVTPLLYPVDEIQPNFYNTSRLAKLLRESKGNLKLVRVRS